MSKVNRTSIEGKLTNEIQKIVEMFWPMLARPGAPPAWQPWFLSDVPFPFSDPLKWLVAN